MDKETNIPYYDDLYLDVVFANGNIKVLDENELLDALNTKSISKKQYDLANKTKNILIESIKNEKIDIYI